MEEARAKDVSSWLIQRLPYTPVLKDNYNFHVWSFSPYPGVN